MVGFELGNILPALFNNLTRLSPIQAQTVTEGCMGVRYTRGRFTSAWWGFGRNEKETGVIPPLSPGLYWHWGWGLQSIREVDVTEGCLDLSMMGIRSADGIEYQLRSSLEWRIEDPHRFLGVIGEDDAAATVRLAARGIIAHELPRYEYGKIWEDTSDITNLLTERIDEKIDRWGFACLAVYLSDKSKSRALRLYGMNDALPDGE